MPGSGLRASIYAVAGVMALPLAAQEFQLDELVLEGADGNTVKNCAAAEARDLSCAGQTVQSEGLVGNTITPEQREGLPEGAEAGDLVKRLPGVVMGGAPGEDKDARVLGLDKEFTRTTIDGVAIPDGGEKRELKLDGIPSAFVGTAEVIRARRASMEADGLAGRVELKFRDLPEGRLREVDIAGGAEEGGEEGYRSSVVFGDKPNDNVAWQFGLGANETPREKIKTKIKGNEVEDEDELKRNQTNGLFFDLGISGQAGNFRIKPIYLDGSEEKDKTKLKFKDLARTDLSEREEEDETKDITTYGAILGWDRHFGGTRVEARFSHFTVTEDKNKTRLKTKFKGGLIDKTETELETEDKEDMVTQFDLGGSTALAFAGGDGAFNYGIRWRERDRFKRKIKTKNGKDDTKPKDIYDLQETYLAGYAELDWPVTSRLTVAPGVRVEYAETTGVAGDGTRNDGNDTFILPSVPFQYRFSELWKLEGGVAAVVNRPKFDQLIPFEEEKGGEIKIGNPNLDPAHGYSVDFDFIRDTGAMRLGFGGFYRYLEDAIEEVTIGTRGGKDIVSPENVGDGWTAGIILSQDLDMAALSPSLAGFYLSSSQTFADSELREEKTGVERRFKDQPEFFGNLALRWESPNGRLSLGTVVIYTGETKKDSTERTEDQWDVGLRAAYKLTDRAELYLEADGLGDNEKVKIKNGEREVEKIPGRLFVGLRATF